MATSGLYVTAYTAWWFRPTFWALKPLLLVVYCIHKPAAGAFLSWLTGKAVRYRSP